MIPFCGQVRAPKIKTLKKFHLLKSYSREISWKEGVSLHDNLLFILYKGSCFINALSSFFWSVHTDKKCRIVKEIFIFNAHISDSDDITDKAW